MDHTHSWRATSKVFAFVCECGSVYHEWLLTENEALHATNPPHEGNGDLRAECTTLRQKLAEAHKVEKHLRHQIAEGQEESALLRDELDAVKQLLEEATNPLSDV